jgi:hypothetical protein
MTDRVDEDSVCYCGWDGIDSDGCTCLDCQFWNWWNSLSDYDREMLRGV